ncbi:MAG: hypothetical protein HN601_05115 [Candidatus Marinimicrobia bacterium]|jgi:hypothetical protein|nr:hypothetical protein [Candidatus Neomarinimicrobiota bacterium]
MAKNTKPKKRKTKMISLQAYNDINGLGRVLGLFWGLISLELVFINAAGYHISFGIKVLHVGFSLTLHS